MSEAHGFLRGLVAVVGFPQTNVLYDRDPRVGGHGKYNRFFGSLVIGMNGIVGFSRYPLHLISLVGLVLSFFAGVFAVTYFIFKLAGAPFPTGNPTIVILISFFGGIQLLSLGIMGEYVGRIYEEVKNRPAYIVELDLGFDPRSPATKRMCWLAAAPILSCRRSRRSRFSPAASVHGSEKGTRHTPKALVPVAGEPFVVHQLRLLARHGAHRVVLCVGFLGEHIEAAIGDGKQFGLDVRVLVRRRRAGRHGGRDPASRPLLGPRFLVTYGDTYLRIDYRAVQARFDAGSRPALMTVLRNDGSWAQSNAVYENGGVTAYDKHVKPEGARWIDYGLLAFDQGVFAEDGPSDLSDTCRNSPHVAS